MRGEEFPGSSAEPEKAKDNEEIGPQPAQGPEPAVS